MKKGGILLSDHIGSFITGAPVPKAETKINILIFDVEHERIKHIGDVTGPKSVNIITIAKISFAK